jgi:hypothetical protein
MTAKDRQWAKGFARQALSDLGVREELVISKSEKCHRLHFLQMAAEKASKAYLIAGNGHDNVKNSHALCRAHPAHDRKRFLRKT